MNQEERVTLNFNRPLRLFPLPECVLLPHATAPLHVFEDRYRAMLRDALDSDGLIAMAVTDAPDPSMLVDPMNPPLKTCVTVGYLVQHDRLEDGRYNILLQGLCRARILEETDRHADGYRSAMLQPFGHRGDGTDEDTLDALREQISDRLSDPALTELPRVQALQTLLASADVSTPALIDLAGMVLSTDSEQRYALLAEENADRRARDVVLRLDTMRELAEQARAGGDDLDESD